MPRASDYLRSKFPDCDGEALAVIYPVTTISAGGIIRSNTPHTWDTLTDREREAICYLCDEWDYAYEPEPA